jgi:hypothetical protein
MKTTGLYAGTTGLALSFDQEAGKRYSQSVKRRRNGSAGVRQSMKKHFYDLSRSISTSSLRERRARSYKDMKPPFLTVGVKPSN